jgi:hypothetical protein
MASSLRRLEDFVVRKVFHQLTVIVARTYEVYRRKTSQQFLDRTGFVRPIAVGLDADFVEQVLGLLAPNLAFGIVDGYDKAR